MHNIMMIPIDALEHHPDNPRKDLGDLKELIASIKESGVMQNLTVVPNPNNDETWYVVIGNRRMEACKAAGLKELPCIISDMDHKTQVATMMAENMQRVDLTLTEQAGGVQMMMDLGMDVGEISKRTVFHDQIAFIYPGFEEWPKFCPECGRRFKEVPSDE